MITNQYVLNCPPDDVQRMLTLYEQKLDDTKEIIQHLKMLADVDHLGMREYWESKHRFDVV